MSFFAFLLTLNNKSGLNDMFKVPTIVSVHFFMLFIHLEFDSVVRIIAL